MAAWLRLTRTPSLGPEALIALLRQIGSAELVLDAGHSQLERVVGAELARALRCSRADAEAACERLLAWLRASPTRRVLTLAHPDYPQQVLVAGGALPMLFADGRDASLGAARLALVGAEQMSEPMLQSAEGFAQALSAAGVRLAVRFGTPLAARVLDAVARVEGADCVGVFEHGLQEVRPAEHLARARTLAAQGTLLSAWAPGEARPRQPAQAPDLLLAALCEAVLVFEAPLHSRALATAQLAAEWGRDVLATPGSIHSSLARGCHRLIRDGARLVEAVDDVLGELPVRFKQ